MAETAPQKSPITAQEMLDFHEFLTHAEQWSAKLLDRRLSQFASAEKLDETVSACKESFAAMSDQDLARAAQVMNVSVENLQSLKNLVAAGAQPATEDAAVVIAVAIAVIYIAIIAGAVAAAKRAQGYERPWEAAKARSVLLAKGPDAMDTIGINSWDAKELKKVVVGCKEVLDFLDTDTLKYYDPKFPIINIEKMANKLWACEIPTTVKVNAEGSITAFFTEWKSDIPKKQFKTLKEHGWTVQELVKFNDELDQLLGEVADSGERYARLRKAQDAKWKEMTPGLWGRIKRYFTESEADKEKRLQTEFMIKAKYTALECLLWGFNTSILVLCGEFIDVCNKIDQYIAKASKVEGAEDQKNAKK